MSQCKAIGCTYTVTSNQDFCAACNQEMAVTTLLNQNAQETLSDKYPAYYKKVGEMTEIDVYAVHHLFNIHDPSGCLHHSSKKLLLSGVRTGGKSRFKDIKEARDTLTRWLQLNEDIQ